MRVCTVCGIQRVHARSLSVSFAPRTSITSTSILREPNRQPRSVQFLFNSHQIFLEIHPNSKSPFRTSPVQYKFLTLLELLAHTLHRSNETFSLAFGVGVIESEPARTNLHQTLRACVTFLFLTNTTSPHQYRQKKKCRLLSDSPRAPPRGCPTPFTLLLRLSSRGLRVLIFTVVSFWLVLCAGE